MQQGEGGGAAHIALPKYQEGAGTEHPGEQELRGVSKH